MFWNVLSLNQSQKDSTGGSGVKKDKVRTLVGRIHGRVVCFLYYISTFPQANLRSSYLVSLGDKFVRKLCTFKRKY